MPELIKFHPGYRKYHQYYFEQSVYLRKLKMKIAITSPNAKTISGHAGKCPGYLIYDVDANQNIKKSHIKLTKEQVFKNFSGPLSQNADHPLSGINTFVTQGLGEGLNNRLSRDGIKVHLVESDDPEFVIASLMSST
jgi:predicted Fe-Mo cluster-binding NifX family protein